MLGFLTIALPSCAQCQAANISAPKYHASVCVLLGSFLVPAGPGGFSETSILRQDWDSDGLSGCALGTKGREGMGKNGDWTEEGELWCRLSGELSQLYREIHTGVTLQNCAKLSSNSSLIEYSLCWGKQLSLAKAILAWDWKWRTLCGLYFKLWGK